MTIQWTVVAATLYIEIAVVLILLFPWIRPSVWNKFFKSRLVSAVARFTTVYSYVGISILVLLFFDAIREVRKYSDSDMIERSSHMADADALMHMRLFRAQRNLYISGFALLLFLIIKRLCGLIIRGAQLEAASEAAIKQAEGANKVAKDLMNAGNGEDTELVEKLKRQLKEIGQELKEHIDDKVRLNERLATLQDDYDNLTEIAQKAGGDKKTD
ncbi:hypothetical protein L596_004827 [Steinernema carpocapsae]|uniref:Endoplasmic reticulum transmembrane protein n=1 Tax=Steinernema carpocapsae TaxID=34508 RepID=A0A4U8UX48_STECR|nr:hypothetical protein L596_004827 [Steinernema carpocapsae]